LTTNTSEKPTGYLQLVRENVNFRYLWLGQLVSLMGDWFNLIASAALIAKLTGSGLAVGGLFVVRMLAQFVMGPIGGMLADRYNRKTLLIVSDILRAMVVPGFLIVDGPGEVWILYVLTAIQLGLSGIFNPTKDAILPDVTKPKELGTANALNSTTWSTMLALGAALGGLVAGEWGLRPAFIIDSLSFLLSAVLINRIRYVSTLPPRQPLNVAAVLKEYFSGLEYLRQHRKIFLLAAQKAAQALAVSSMFQIIQVEISSKHFVLGDGGSTSLGLMYAAVGVGTGVSPIVARYFCGDDEKLLRKAISWGYVIAGAGLLIVAPMISFNVVLAGTFLRGFGVAIVWVFSTTLLLKKLPNKVRGRVFGTEYALFTLMNAVGAPISGWVLDNVSNPIPKLLIGMTVLVLFFGLVWTLLGVLRHSKENQPAPVPGD
jgi:MFS family permease